MCGFRPWSIFSQYPKQKSLPHVAGSLYHMTIKPPKVMRAYGHWQSRHIAQAGIQLRDPLGCYLPARVSHPIFHTCTSVVRFVFSALRSQPSIPSALPPVRLPRIFLSEKTFSPQDVFNFPHAVSTNAEPAISSSVCSHVANRQCCHDPTLAYTAFVYLSRQQSNCEK